MGKNMKWMATILLLGSVFFGSCDPLYAGTVAYWRFEDGSAGTEHNDDRDNWYQDISGNGNHLSSWGSQSRPMATTDRPFATVPQTGAANNLALDYDGNDDLGTFGSGTKMIDSYMFINGWTVEASFKMRGSHWQVLVGKDGKPNENLAEPVFYFKHRDDNHRLDCLFFDNNGDFHWTQTREAIVSGQWYSVAATYDNSIFKLYLKSTGDEDYVLQGTLIVPAGATLGQWTEYWTVGRGMWDHNPVDFVDGLIDEVRISDTALAPSEFLGVD
ncbi:MAG: hypothetical protein DRP64_13810 [Verrucomicrobia bacterium]|nr:MAG: hypothetical protein DRP64_13810 [Verrucomicrobiota bacterium]